MIKLDLGRAAFYAAALGGIVVYAVLSDLESTRPVEPMTLAGEESSALLKRLVERYGAPDRSDFQSAVWFRRAPWKRLSLRAAPRLELEQAVDYRVRPGDERLLLQLGIGVRGRARRSELVARGLDESRNILALNVAHRCLSGQSTPLAARAEFHAQLRLLGSGKRVTDAESLLFAPPPPPAEPTGPISPPGFWM